ncbi:MAG: hypothetical protein KIT17_11300 [Rubrivivax sp.]|nr:hypothetical protein [Rubrivivax sp.]
MSRDHDLERDPRLQAALRHAPDADQNAPPLLRARILAAAHRRAGSLAQQGERRRAWWRLDFDTSPWRLGGAGTAAAAVLAATVLWVGRDEQPQAPDLRPRAGDTRHRDAAPAEAVTAREAEPARPRDSASDTATPRRPQSAPAAATICGAERAGAASASP